MTRGDRGAPAGRAWRIHRFDEPGAPSEVDLASSAARRLTWLRSQYRGEVLCDAWMDRDGEVYLTPRKEVPRALPARPAPAGAVRPRARGSAVLEPP